MQFRKLNPARCPSPALRMAARRNSIAVASRRLLALALVAAALVAAAQDNAPTDPIVDLRAKVDALLLRDDLTPEQAIVLKEMRAGLDVAAPEDLDPDILGVFVTIAGGWMDSQDDPTQRAVVDVMASFAGLLVRPGELTDEQAAELEAKLLLEPDDVAARTKLVTHYHGDPQEASRRAHGEHVVWLIENAPYAEVLGSTGRNRIDPRMSEAYITGRNAWQRHVEREPENPVFIARYARFVQWEDWRSHIELLERASSLDSGNVELALELGHKLLIASKHTEDKARAVQAAEDALEQFDRVYAMADSDIARNSILGLGGRAQAAFAAGRYDLAKKHAQAMLEPRPRPDGDLLHGGNTILGRVALIEGEVAQAKSHLLASGDVPSSPALGSFGPSMSLASELLELGHRDVVLDYFDLCAAFWDAGELRVWRASINAGMPPDFGYHVLR